MEERDSDRNHAALVEELRSCRERLAAVLHELRQLERMLSDEASQPTPAARLQSVV